MNRKKVDRRRQREVCLENMRISLVLIVETYDCSKKCVGVSRRHVTVRKKETMKKKKRKKNEEKTKSEDADREKYTCWLENMRIRIVLIVETYDCNRNSVREKVRMKEEISEQRKNNTKLVED